MTATAVCILILLLLATVLPLSNLRLLPVAHAQAAPGSAAIAPTRYWGAFFGTSGDVQIDINRKGIAVRVEIPREFLEGVIRNENETHFIESDIRNDYYYYSVVDESLHWTYDWNRTASDGACFKPSFAIYDPNAPWCVEIWNYLNGTFLNFTAPRFVRFRGLNAPSIAGLYNFTLFVANQTNRIGYPDFVNAWNTTLIVPVSMNDNPAAITGTICDDDDPSNLCPPILAKGVIYAKNINTGQVARAYVNQTTGRFNVTGLAPGDYQLQASAGVFNGVAYSLSEPMNVLSVQRGQLIPGVVMHLKRAPQVCGVVKYRNSLDPVQTNFLAHSLTDHPYLPKVGFKVLNITVEATDPQGHVYRYQNVSLDTDSDTFRIITGVGLKYVGTDPYGTEFAGLPPAPPSYQMAVNVWITGYLQKFSELAQISSSPGPAIPVPCSNVVPNPVVMESGGVISGTVEFHDLDLFGTETPHEGELALGLGVPTDRIFGGNILIRAYDHTGLLKGIVVINGTFPDGTTIYTNSVSVPFYVVGFSEFYNRTWAGTWAQKDYGLPEDTSGYQLTVLIRGYEQKTTSAITITKGANQTVTVRMVRGGAIQVGVFSFNNRFGTRALQAEKLWRFINFSIPIRARVYFYDSAGRTVGYEERLMVLGVPQFVGQSSFFVLFAGQNWSLREIWFFGFQPTHLTGDTYTVRGYTLGYVQQRDVSTFVDLTGLSKLFLPLLLGNEIDLTSPVFAEPSLFGSITEHDHVIGEAYAGSLAGATPGNLSAGIPTLSLPIFGFGGMVQDTSFTGQGHFFYVSPDGTRHFDNGLDVGDYSVQIPEFGFNRHFMTMLPSVSTSFHDLFLATGVFLNVISMARIIQGFAFNPTALVSGWVAGLGVNQTAPLTWVKVEAVNGSYSRSVPTLDGRYDGVGALNLPAGIYNITFSVAFYQPQTQLSMQVIWNGTYSLLPPLGPLCPLADPSVCTSALVISQSPPSSSSEGYTLVANLTMKDQSAIPPAFSWSATEGQLNTTTGQAVMWLPSNSTNATVTLQALVQVGPGNQIITANIKLTGSSHSSQPIPEFNAAFLTMAGCFTLASAALIAVRRQRKPMPTRRSRVS